MVELVLKVCTAMEVCRVEELEELGQQHVYDSSDEPDPEEAEEDDISDYVDPEGALDSEPFEQCRLASANTSWPTTTLGQKVVLSNLHTFEIYPFELTLSILSFPALRCVGARLDMDLLNAPDPSLAILDQGLGDIYPHLTHVDQPA